MDLSLSPPARNMKKNSTPTSRLPYAAIIGKLKILAAMTIRPDLSHGGRDQGRWGDIIIAYNAGGGDCKHVLLLLPRDNLSTQRLSLKRTGTYSTGVDEEN